MFKLITFVMKILVLIKLCQGSIINTKQVTIYSNTDIIIDSFDGVLVDSNFTFNQDFQLSNPCSTFPQTINVTPYSKNITQIINQAFEDNFVDGHQKSSTPKLIGIGKVGLGIIVLSQQGVLIFYTQENNKYDIRSLQQYQELNGIEKAFIEFLEDQIVILSDRDAWILKPNFSQHNIFENAHLDNVHMQVGLGNIHKLHTIQNYLFLTFLNQGFGIYRLENAQLQILQKVELKSIIDSLVVVKEDKINVLILDREVGIHFYVYNKIINEMHKNQIINTFKIKCSFFEYVQSNLFILTTQDNPNLNTLSIYTLDFQNPTLNLKYSKLIEGEVQGIEIITDHFILYNRSQITVFYGNLGEIIKLDSTNFLIPGTRQLIFRKNEQKQNQIVGITNNEFFALDVSISKIRLVCYVTQDYPDEFSFNYELSTVLPTENNSIKYDIFVIFPLKRQQKMNWILTVIFIIFCLSISILIVLLLNWHKYSKIKNQTGGQFQEFGIDTLKTTKRVEPQMRGHEETDKNVQCCDVIQTCLPASRHPIIQNEHQH
ncbi:unnamed protein product (macronuclear) [Paramecium tetraurelia]|uniref:Transmembrane protein n=1 Tax=Paramecium tetraurelia TaxID=5888 RepID=A0BKN4_PARTE|nr:uncharacterized protein GSPATT00029732001 [Paramecium tetraurelia]CAK59101.1 unnamed protein product [Paramecium tetraurelia]|eukprot:XP_001426499.1 hypothetical protein (macronuclear) [Paramecium tetraurelia strain d4-2]